MAEDAAVPRKPKGLLVDNLGHCALVLSALAYFALFVGAVVAGVLGPPIFSSATNPAAQLSQQCESPSTCSVTWFGTLTDMSSYHQFMWLNMNMQRPTLLATGAPALPNIPVTWSLLYQVDITAIATDGTRISMALNQSHLQSIAFDTNAAKSGDVLLFYTQVRLRARPSTPLAPPPPPHAAAHPNTLYIGAAGNPLPRLPAHGALPEPPGALCLRARALAGRQHGLHHDVCEQGLHAV